MRQTDVEQKPSADEREAYKRTLREETAVEEKHEYKRGKPQAFNLDFLKFMLNSMANCVFL